MYRGYEQMPVTGTSMRYTLAARPTSRPRKQVQYFEMMGHRGIYADGWKAVTRHTTGRARSTTTSGSCTTSTSTGPSATTWPATSPTGWRRWSSCGGREADEHGVLPLDDRTIELFGARERAVAEQLSKGLAGLAAAAAGKDTPHQPSSTTPTGRR